MVSTSNDFAYALFSLAVENGKLKEFKNDLDCVKAVFSDNPDYVILLSSPSLSKAERTALIEKAFDKKVCELVKNFLKVLCEHNKIYMLDDCIKVFSELRKQAENRVTAHVFSAVPLDESQISKLKSNLEKKLGVEVKIRQKIDKSMIGGIRIEFEDKIIDGSIKKQLSEIKEVISG